MPFRASPWLLSALLSLLLATESMAQVSGNTGSFRTSIPIAVPTFRGLEPRLSLSYSSSGGNGAVGVGWALTGFSYIERQGADGGSPNYDATDSFRLGGADLHACGASASPGCLAGGTHFTEHESYQRITFDGSLEWTVDARDGTTSTYTPLLSVASQTFRWGLTSVADTLGNTVTYNWWCDRTNDCYPADVTYNGYRVKFHWDGSRSDHLSFATGASIVEMGQRLRTIEVGLTDGTAIRAYALQYSTSPSTGRSLLDSVQMYGTDVVIDAGGVVTGGSSLPSEWSAPSYWPIETLTNASARAAKALGGIRPMELCGRRSLYSRRHRSILKRASSKSRNQLALRHSSRNVALKDSMKAFCVGLPG